MVEMGKVPSKMTKKELTKFLCEQLVLLSKTEARLAEVAALAHDGGLHTSDQWEVLCAIRRLTLPHWNKSGSEVERKVRVAIAFGAADSADEVPDPPYCQRTKTDAGCMWPECGCVERNGVMVPK